MIKEFQSFNGFYLINKESRNILDKHCEKKKVFKEILKG